MTGVASQGIDLSALFDPDVMGDGPVAWRILGAGQPVRFAALKYGQQRADTGILYDNVDVARIWCARGTAAYVNRGGVPDYVSDLQVVSPSGGSANAFVLYRANGTVIWSTDSGGGSGVWLASGNGAPYSIKFQNLGTSGGGSFSGADNVWRQLNADRSVNLTKFASGGSSQTGGGTGNIQLRRDSDGVILLNFNCNFSASVVSDG